VLAYPPGDLSFPNEQLDELGPAYEVAMHELERAHLPRSRVPGSIDDRHSALAEHTLDAVTRTDDGPHIYDGLIHGASRCCFSTPKP